jgi:hypothetical protein
MDANATGCARPQFPEHNMPTTSAPEPKYDSLFELFTRRLYWFAVGPMLMILMLLGIFNGERNQLIGFNIGYLVCLAGLPLSKWLDMRSGQAMTADGKPATWADFRKYVITALIIGIGAVLVANAWAYYSSAR